MKNKSFTLINIVGLTIGLTSAFLIYLWIQDEYAIDRFHEKLSLGEMMEVVVDTIKLDKDHMGSTSVCTEDDSILNSYIGEKGKSVEEHWLLRR